MIVKIIFIIVIIIIIVVVVALIWMSIYPPIIPPPPPPAEIKEGPTCTTYYVNDRLMTCRDKHEFRYNRCVPIDEIGCTAAENPTTITRAEMVCGGDRTTIRDRNRPCQLIRDCVSGDLTVTKEGNCWQSQGINEYVEVECMQVPGCRHLDLVHVPDESFEDVSAVEDVPCPRAPDDNRIYRNIEQPCFTMWLCINYEHFLNICTPRCIGDRGNCVGCETFERCLYHTAYTPLTAIANPILEFIANP